MQTRACLAVAAKLRRRTEAAKLRRRRTAQQIRACPAEAAQRRRRKKEPVCRGGTAARGGERDAAVGLQSLNVLVENLFEGLSAAHGSVIGTPPELLNAARLRASSTSDDPQQ